MRIYLHAFGPGRPLSLQGGHHARVLERVSKLQKSENKGKVYKRATG